jgi:hypothetical protein
MASLKPLAVEVRFDLLIQLLMTSILTVTSNHSTSFYFDTFANWCYAPILF